MNLAKNFKAISAYKLEKHTDDWDKTYCCHTSVHIIDISRSNSCIILLNCNGLMKLHYNNNR